MIMDVYLFVFNYSLKNKCCQATLNKRHTKFIDIICFRGVTLTYPNRFDSVVSANSSRVHMKYNFILISSLTPSK